MVLFQSSMGTLLLINTGIVDGAALLVARVGLFWGEGGGGSGIDIGARLRRVPVWLLCWWFC